VRAAVEASEVVVLATPWNAAADAVQSAGDYGGRVLVDVTNPIGPGFALVHGHTTSGAEELAKLARGARVVKAFNSTGLENMAEPRYGTRRALMLVAGDDTGARDAVVTLANDLGFEGIGLPSLSRARDLEPLGMLWISLSLRPHLGRDFAFGFLRRTRPDEPVARRAPEERRITVVGTGNIGGALARAWIRAGHAVRLAVRDTSAADVKALVALGAEAAPVAGAAAGADVVACAVPAGAVEGVLPVLGSLDGKVVIDATNAIGAGFTLRYGHTTSAAEQLQARIPRARVVKSFNQQGAELLSAPRFDGVPATNFVAGDDEAARRVVTSLTEDVGLEAVDAGALSRARYLEPLTLAWIAAARALGTREIGLAMLRRGS
jgi:predicted dinucleotide-binding enzyme